MEWSTLEPVLVAAAIGVMIGAERERSHRDTPDHFGGVRTFTVLAVTGALASLISSTVVAVGLGSAALLVAASAWSSLRTHAGSTTVLVTLSTCLLGALTRSSPELAVGIAVVLVVILMSKERVHRLLREQVSEAEVEDAVKFATAGHIDLIDRGPAAPSASVSARATVAPRTVFIDRSLLRL